MAVASRVSEYAANISSRFRFKMSSILLLTLCASVAVGMPPPLSSVTLPPDVPDIPDLSSSTCNCELQFCMPVFNCANGYIAKDSCNCCDVCIKIQAMAKCGHRADSVGKCGPGLLCKVRHPHSMENEILPPDEKVGRCEPGETSSTVISHVYAD